MILPPSLILILTGFLFLAKPAKSFRFQYLLTFRALQSTLEFDLVWIEDQSISRGSIPWNGIKYVKAKLSEPHQVKLKLRYPIQIERTGLPPRNAASVPQITTTKTIKLKAQDAPTKLRNAAQQVGIKFVEIARQGQYQIYAPRRSMPTVNEE